MKKELFIIIICCAVKCELSIAQAGEWAWMNGDTVMFGAAVFGTLGVSNPANTPPALYESCGWTDHQNNFWLFGGVGSSSIYEYNTFWKLTPDNNEWTWIQGSSVCCASGVYGSMGIPSSVNIPGARGWGVPTWVDTAGNLWLFGGYGYSSNGNVGQLNDLWKYDINTSQWTWMHGSQYAGAFGSYGTIGLPDPSNDPPGRYETVAAWTDLENNLWLFGGKNDSGHLNDLWKFNTSTLEWVWIKGSNGYDSNGVYGTQGIADTLNTPGAWKVYSSWKNPQGDLFMFGGAFGYYTTTNEVWKFDIAANAWTWLGGSPAIFQSSYSALCLFDTLNHPSGRYETHANWSDECGNLVLYGGIQGSYSSCADLWMYSVNTNEWSCIWGDTLQNSIPAYGTKGVFSPTNKPGGRFGSVGWRDNEGNLWMFGGAEISFGKFNDLWKFKIDTSCAAMNLCQQVPGFAASTTLCEKFCTNFFDQSFNNATAWQWNFEGGSPSSSSDQNPINICYNTPGTYDVTLITTNANGNDTHTFPNYITVYPTPPFPTITQVYYTLTSSPAASYQWQFNSVDIPGATNQSYTVLQSGHYTVIVSDDHGCVNSFTRYVLISGINDMIGDANILIYPNPSNGNFIVELLNGIMAGEISINVVNMLGQKVFSSTEKIYSFPLIKEINLKDKVPGIYFIEIKSQKLFQKKKIMITK